MPSPQATKELITRFLGPSGALGLVPSIGEANVDVRQVDLAFNDEMSLARLRIVTEAALTIDLAAATGAQAGGVKILEFPTLAFTPLQSRVRATLSLTAGTATATAGELGLGTTIATGGVAVLGGTAGFEDILEGVTLGNIAAGASLDTDVMDSVRDLLDGRASADSVFLNYATTVGVAATDVTVASGAIIDLLGIFASAA